MQQKLATNRAMMLAAMSLLAMLWNIVFVSENAFLDAGMAGEISMVSGDDGTHDVGASAMEVGGSGDRGFRQG